jgi:hypothetical protein
LAARRAGGQRRRPFRLGRGDPVAGVGVLHQQGQADAEDGPEQRSHDDQELAKSAKRSVHGVSRVE